MTNMNPIESKIVIVILKNEEYMTTAQIAKKAKISWNTAEIYLEKMFEKGWVDKLGDRTKYWKAIIE